MEQMGFILSFLAFVIIIGGYFYWLTLEKKGGHKIKKSAGPAFNKALVSQKWLEIGEMMRTGGPANFRQAIVESDKLVDMVLKTRASGETMGERLRNGKNLFEKETYNNLWTAHKLRNKVVHEAEFEGLSYDAKLAVRYFEKALKELRAI